MKQTLKPLKPGTPVQVTRINKEIVTAETMGPPIPHLLPFGEFYMVRAYPKTPAPYWAGRGRKSRARLLWEAQFHRIGMYNRRELRLI